MIDYPTLSFRELTKKVKKLGFKKVRQKGSHVRYVHSDGRKTIIPDHGSKSVPHGLLIKIIRYDLEMNIEDFFDNG